MTSNPKSWGEESPGWPRGPWLQHPAYRRWPALGRLFWSSLSRFWGVRKTFRDCPLRHSWELCLKTSTCLCLLACPRSHTPQGTPVLAPSSDYPSPRQAVTHHLLSLSHFLPTPEEDPCACESIVKFQTKVEGLLQALTRKHILSQKPLWGGGEVRRTLLGGGRRALPLVWWGRAGSCWRRAGSWPWRLALALVLTEERQKPRARSWAHTVLDTVRKTWCLRTPLSQALGDLPPHQTPLRWGRTPHSSPGSGRTQRVPSRPKPAPGQGWAFQTHRNCLLVFGKRHPEGRGWVGFDTGESTRYGEGWEKVLQAGPWAEVPPCPCPAPVSPHLSLTPSPLEAVSKRLAILENRIV